jgi:hypothetical protein
VKILTEADAARNGVGVEWVHIFEAVGRISTALATVDDTTELRRPRDADEDEAANEVRQ